MSWEQTLADLVAERTGIALSPRQLRSDVRRRIERRIEELGLSGPEAWVWHLARAPRGSNELAWLIEAVTVGYSYFFRDADQLDVAVEVLRELAGDRGPRRSLQVWCAGCSTGQEPWSLAILAERAGLAVDILATDLNARFLGLARAGEYSEKDASRIPVELRDGLEVVSGGVRVRDRLHARVTFREHNLVASGLYPTAPDGGPFQLILCRNVFIYFSDPVRERVASRLSRALEPRGWLFLGPGESLEGLDVPLAPRPWGHRLGYCPAPVGGPLRSVRAPTPLPAPRRRAPFRTAEDPLDAMVSRAQSGDLAGAELELAALASRSDDARSWAALAHIRIRLHRFQEALAACERAQELDPLLVAPHLAEGLVHRKLGEMVAAERAFRQALFLDPDAWVAALLLSGVYARLGRDRERRAARLRAEQGMDRGTAGSSAVPLFGVEDLDPDWVRTRMDS